MNILNALADRVAGGEQLRPGGPNVTVGETELRLGSVHPVHLASGLVGYWRMYYEWRGGAPPPLEVVQVLPPPGDRLRLARPHTRLQPHWSEAGVCPGQTRRGAC